MPLLCAPCRHSSPCRLVTWSYSCLITLFSHHSRHPIVFAPLVAPRLRTPFSHYSALSQIRSTVASLCSPPRCSALGLHWPSGGRTLSMQCQGCMGNREGW